ncbi:uncharacterized protein PV09_02699 [Verruconis gallopava]|uniref:Rgp1-domain-containing protein n=1 Tax=Verruconis gallopava TaxID=253628 RepID=A0A0D2AH28_9PEZI|nr:uncharacterized protein PV09_02699 [Verruconis gallopava]KIW06223.1 hypothetical protein PV09_02699 [Verruconis gallopava]
MASRYHQTSTPSNIRVSVTFDTPTVFAGEDVACTITFKNIAREHGSADRSPSRSPRSPHYSGTALLEQQRARKVTPIHAQGSRLGIPSPTRHSSYGPNIPPHLRKAAAQQHKPSGSIGTESEGPNHREGGSRPRHGRSLSILSMGTDVGTVASVPSRGGLEGGGIRSPRGGGHGRTMSLQTAPRRASSGKPDAGPSSGQGSPRIVGPIITEQDVDGQRTIRAKRHNASSRPLSEAKRSPGILQQDFKFPAAPDVEDAPLSADAESAVSPKTDSLPFRSLPPPTQESNANPIARVLSQSSANGSPRSSLDLHSEVMSNHSDETFISEYVPQQLTRLLPRSNHVRTNSRLGVRDPPRGPETIMMGYAQMMGSFTLEGSLVNQAPFEEIKRKGVVGSQGGGGVVGVERTKRDSGLFGSFGWGNIGESIGGLLGGSELSSIKEMRGIANQKSIPLITTPPSILFVDLTLAPGETKSYSYRFTLPRGLPPSHRGRAIKVTYQLVISAQRPGKGREQQVRSVDVPFRVFGSVDPSGEILGHDLMSPYILLRDQARTSVVDTTASKPDIKPKKPPDREGEADFRAYTSALLDKSGPNGQPALLSPTSPLAPSGPLNTNAMRRQSSVGEAPQTQLEIIDFAILRANHQDQRANGWSSSSSGRLSNKFDIARSGRHVATLHLTRPAYRLGETIHLVASFKGASIPTYAIQVALETRETVDPAIAMRSAASIYRYTRKVHAYDAASALFAKRLSFALAIPGNATPEFVTAGISLEWRLRVEFVTPRISVGEDEDLLEEVIEDDRGVILQGIEGLRVENFEVAVPLRIYGGVTSGGAAECDVEDMPV